MQSPEIYRLLTRRIRRGLIIFPILWLIAVGLGAWALITPGSRSWAAAAFLCGLLLHLATHHVRKRGAAAWRVSENPHLVYWAHATTIRQPVVDRPLDDCTFLMLHLRDGTELEVGLPVVDMRRFLAWLRERNASVRWGAYDRSDDPTSIAPGTLD